MKSSYNRRAFLRRSLGVSAGFGLATLGCQETTNQTEDVQMVAEAGPLFKISLAEWSLHPLIFSPSRSELPGDAWEDLMDNDYSQAIVGELDHLEFARVARDFGFDAIEYSNQFFMDRAQDAEYLREMKMRADDHGVQSLLIMIDREGDLGDPDEAARVLAIENHHKWVEAAVFLGCHSIRVNAESSGSYEEQQQLAADGLRRLCEFADPFNINVIVENHGGLSSSGEWLAGVMDLVGHPRIGTLPDFGNFNMAADDEPEDEYDRYKGVQELMPYAKAVSAKSHDFDAQGNETATDYAQMMRIVLDAGYRGYVGIEYEGNVLSPMDGIAATKELLERVREELAPDYA